MKRLSLLCAVGLLFVWPGCGSKSAGSALPVCGNGETELGEECDGEDLADETCETLGLGTGTLACAGDCTFDVTGCSGEAQCGNDVLEYPEECDLSQLGGASCEDLGFSGGTLGCTIVCTYDISQCEGSPECGDEVVVPPEQCDGNNLDNESCETLGLGDGTLRCADDCTFDVADCSGIPECGNELREFPEECDASDLAGEDCTTVGYTGGTLECTEGCEFDLGGCTLCGDGTAEGDETCDGSDLDGHTCQSMGFTDGTLACTAACTLDVSGCTLCGNNTAEGSEECDGPDLRSQTCVDQGFDGGTLTCGEACTFNTSGCYDYVCGNGIQEASEECDGTDLAGATCESRGYEGGFLGCTNGCTYDESLCSDCALTDTTAPVAGGHIPAPGTQGAPQDTNIEVRLFDACEIDFSSIHMYLTVTPPFGMSWFGEVFPVITGSGTDATVIYDRPNDFQMGTIVEVQVTAQDTSGNPLDEQWAFSVIAETWLTCRPDPTSVCMNIIDEAHPDTNYSGNQEAWDIGGGGGSDRRTLIRLNGPLPVGSLVLQARMHWGLCPPGSSVNTTIECYRVNVQSNGAQATWNNRTTGDTWTLPGANDIPADRQGTAGANHAVPITSTPYEALEGDAMQLAVDWASGEPNHGILCVTPSATTISVCSNFSNFAPRIHVLFGPPIP